MRTLFLAWVLVAVSAVACVQYSTRDNRQPLTPAFDYVCAEITERYDWVSCVGLEPPVLVLSRVVNRKYIGFYYPGEKYIFIRSDLNPTRVRNVIVHETVHYVIDHLNILVSHCHSELIAREITSEYSGKAVDPTWKKRYGCGLTINGRLQCQL